MEFIKPDINLNIIGFRKIAYVLSLTMIVLTVVSLVLHNGPKYGIDFAGGNSIRVKFSAPVTTEAIKDAIKPIGLSGATVQELSGQGIENEFRIRAKQSEEISEQLKDVLIKSVDANVEIRRISKVGPQVGQALREKALLAMFYALLFITVYISGRFELKWVPALLMAGAIGISSYSLSSFNVSIPIQMCVALVIAIIGFWVLRLQFAMGAIMALIHDVIVTVGFFSFFGKEFNLPIIAALLTIIGYSLNDTIIVFDRIRENSKKHSRKPMDFIINRSINETLSRTILTSLTTLLVVVCLFVFGGAIIHDFAFALIVGICVGTYSSVYVASPILLAWQKAPGAKA